MPTTTAPLGSPFGLPAIVEGDPAPTGLSPLCRFIDSGKKDYTINSATGHFTSMPVVRQRVLLIMLTVLKSSSVLRGMGIEMPRKMNDGFEAIAQQRVRAAYRQMTEVEKVMFIDDIIVAKLSTGRASITLVYTDLTTGKPDVVSTEDLEALNE